MAERFINESYIYPQITLFPKHPLQVSMLNPRDGEHFAGIIQEIGYDAWTDKLNNPEDPDPTLSDEAIRTKFDPTNPAMVERQRRRIEKPVDGAEYWVAHDGDNLKGDIYGFARLELANRTKHLSIGGLSLPPRYPNITDVEVRPFRDFGPMKVVRAALVFSVLLDFFGGNKVAAYSEVGSEEVNEWMLSMGFSDKGFRPTEQLTETEKITYAHFYANSIVKVRWALKKSLPALNTYLDLK